MNPFQSLYAQCNTGTSAEKYAALPDFPRMLDIELTSACNFRCLMCPTGNLSLKRDAEFMREGTMLEIIDQCRDHVPGLRLIGWGEPLLNVSIVDFIIAATEIGSPTHLNTNGSLLTRHLAIDLVDAGLSSIKFSFQGVDAASYREMRNTDFFEGVIEAIGYMRRARGDQALPWIAVSTSTTSETPEMIEAFRERVAPLADQVSVGRTIFDFMDLNAVRLKDEDRERLERLRVFQPKNLRHPSPCPEVFDKLSIHADGSVVLCCNDFDGVVTLGNVNKTPIAELWRHPKIEAYRERLARRDYDAPLCKTCWSYMEGTA